MSPRTAPPLADQPTEQTDLYRLYLKAWEYIEAGDTAGLNELCFPGCRFAFNHVFGPPASFIEAVQKWRAQFSEFTISREDGGLTEVPGGRELVADDRTILTIAHSGIDTGEYQTTVIGHHVITTVDGLLFRWVSTFDLEPERS